LDVSAGYFIAIVLVLALFDGLVTEPLIALIGKWRTIATQVSVGFTLIAWGGGFKILIGLTAIVVSVRAVFIY
jgi:hypothetical protein